jgi:hypothetical protein
MEAEVAPKSTTLAFMVVSLLEAAHILLVAIMRHLVLFDKYGTSGEFFRCTMAPMPQYSGMLLSVLLAIALVLVFARRLVKQREVRPEPDPRICATLGGSAILVVALQCVLWGSTALFAWGFYKAGYISYKDNEILVYLVATSKGIGPAFLILLAGLLLVISFGMTRPRTVYLDEDHEVWGPPRREE